MRCCTRLALAALLPSVALHTLLLAQKPGPDSTPTPGPVPGKAIPGLAVSPPAPLSRTDIESRIRKETGTSIRMPMAAGATTALGPARLQVGSTQLLLYNVEVIGAQGGSVKAVLYGTGSGHERGVIGVRFQGAPGARFMLDLSLTNASRLGVSLSNADGGQVAYSAVAVQDGHLLHVVQTATGGTYTAFVLMEYESSTLHAVTLTRLP